MVPIWRRVEEYQIFLKFETTGDEIRLVRWKDLWLTAGILDDRLASTLHPL